MLDAVVGTVAPTRQGLGWAAVGWLALLGCGVAAGCSHHVAAVTGIAAAAELGVILGELTGRLRARRAAVASAVAVVGAACAIGAAWPLAALYVPALHVAGAGDVRRVPVTIGLLAVLGAALSPAPAAAAMGAVGAALVVLGARLDRAGLVEAELLARLQHELRTPLAGISGLVARLGAGPVEPAAMAQLQRASERLRCVVDDLCIVTPGADSAPAAGVMRVDEVVEEIVEALRPPEGGLALDVVIDPSARASVVGPRARIEKLAGHLIGNALKFTLAGGARVRLSATRATTGLRFELRVEDTGPGVAPAWRDRIFRPFAQVDGARTRANDGMGLGLTVARRVAKALDGGVRLERTGRDGSVFVATFDLPRAERVVRLVPPPARRPGVHALVVDDDPVQQVIARSFLQSLGVTCDVVGSGVAACAAFDPARHDVVLLDVHMPGMSGLEVFDVLRARPDGGAVHVVALTADPGAAVAHGGFDDVLAKPTRVDDLRRALAPVFPVDFELAKAC